MYMRLQIVAQSFRHAETSTLLIPTQYRRLLARALGPSTMEDLLIRLTSAGVPTGVHPGALRIRYQQSGLKLFKYNFRVNKAVWFRLGQMARALGISRCLLFVALLRTFVEKMYEFPQQLKKVRWRLIEVLDFGIRRRFAILKTALINPPDG